MEKPKNENEPTIEKLGQQLKEGKARLRKELGVEELPDVKELEKNLEEGKKELKRRLLREDKQDLKQAG